MNVVSLSIAIAAAALTYTLSDDAHGRSTQATTRVGAPKRICVSDDHCLDWKWDIPNSRWFRGSINKPFGTCQATELDSLCTDRNIDCGLVVFATDWEDPNTWWSPHPPIALWYPGRCE